MQILPILALLAFPTVDAPTGDGVMCFKLAEGVFRCMDTLTNTSWTMNHNATSIECQLDFRPKCEVKP